MLSLVAQSAVQRMITVHVRLQLLWRKETLAVSLAQIGSTRHNGKLFKYCWLYWCVFFKSYTNCVSGLVDLTPQLVELRLVELRTY
jgi:hypothetical protein